MNENTRPPVIADEAAPAFSTANTASPPVQKGSFGRSPWGIAVLVLLVLIGWQWLENGKLADRQDELAQRLAEDDSTAKEALRQAQDQIAAAQARLIAIEGRLDESRSQQDALERMYQDISRNRDEWVLAEIEQGISLASQQLQVAGNVKAAVIALQSADARLASGSRPQLLALRRVLARDLDRLRAVPQADLPGMGLRLEGIVGAIDTLPLLADSRLKAETAPASKPAAASQPNFWQPVQRFGNELWSELRGLIRIQRFDLDEPALLAPGQEFYLRENLKLRLLNARLALLARDQATFRSEMKQAHAWMERYFDGKNAAVQSAQSGLKQLMASEIGGELPTLNESLTAIRSFRPGRSQGK